MKLRLRLMWGWTGNVRIGDHPGATAILDPGVFAGTNPVN